MKDHTHLKTTVVRVYGSGVRIIPHSPQFSLMSVFALISMKIHLSTKELYGLFWTMSLLWSPCRLFFFWSTKPPNWLCHIPNRPHSLKMDRSWETLHWFRCASKKWTGSQKREHARNIKERWMDDRQSGERLWTTPRTQREGQHCLLIFSHSCLPREQDGDPELGL